MVVMFAYLRCWLHCLRRSWAGHRMCSIHDDLLGRTAAVFCDCGAIFYHEIPDGWGVVDDYLKARRR